VTTPRGRQGQLVVSTHPGEPVTAFVPRPLPPDPQLDLLPLVAKLERANQSLGRLDAISTILPSPDVFLFMYVRKEALLSSQIEGTQSSLSELLTYENDGPAAGSEDVVEVSNYLTALNHGLARMNDLPLSLRLIREMHGKLLERGRGRMQQPGEFRTSQNWIGGTRPGNALFVPPPPGEHLASCLAELEKFLHRTDLYSPLIRAALAHVQFETIHPFLDGNGRIGRLLITLMLLHDGVLHQPTLYLSLYLKTHRQRYYDLLQQVRFEGKWETWLEFFTDGIIETAEQGVATARELIALFEHDRRRIESRKRAGSALRVHYDLQRNPMLAVPHAATRLKLSNPTVQTAVETLIELGIVEEVTGRKRDRLYRYARYLEIMERGTEPLPR
jgi:Fic family protein